jgi:hypothetical protein
VALVHLAELVAQLLALLGQADMDRAAIVLGAFLNEIVVLDHLLDVVGHVRAEVAAAQGQLTDRHLGIADIVQDEALHVIDVVDPQTVELELDDLEKMTVQAFDQPDRFEILGLHDAPRKCRNCQPS